MSPLTKHGTPLSMETTIWQPDERKKYLSCFIPFKARSQDLVRSNIRRLPLDLAKTSKDYSGYILACFLTSSPLQGDMETRRHCKPFVLDTPLSALIQFYLQNDNELGQHKQQFPSYYSKSKGLTLYLRSNEGTTL